MERAMVTGVATLRRVAAVLPSAAAFTSAQARLLFRLAVIIYAVGALVGAVLELGAFADGGFFIYGMASGDPWHLNWNAMPVRASTYALTILPITVLARFGLLPIGSIGWLYSLWFLSLPFLFLLLGFPLVKRERRFVLAYPAIQMLTTGLFLYGFPSDLWVTQGEFWVALLAVVGGADDRRRVPAFAVAFALMLFSHDGAVLLGGLIVATLIGRILGLAPVGEARRRMDVILLGYSGLLVLVWAVLKLTWTYPDPVLARAIAHGAGGLANPISLVRSKAFLLAFVTAAGFCVMIVRQSAPPARSTAVILLVAAGLAAGVVYVMSPWPGSRYMLRGVMLAAMLLLGALAVADTWRLAPTAPAAPGSASEPRRWAAWAFLLVIAIVVQQTVRNVAFARDWAAYRQIVRTLTHGDAPTNGEALPQQMSVAAAHLPARQRRLLKDLSWGFALPFQSFVFGDDFRTDRMLFNPVPMPFGCSAFGQALAPASRLPVVAKRRILDHVCADAPAARGKVRPNAGQAGS